MNTDILALSESLVDSYQNTNPASGQFTGTEGAYLLPHTEVEIERLRRQHQFFGSATNRKLLRYPLQSGAKVLDSGCADGTWLQDLNSQHGNQLDLYGVDLSALLFPRRNRGGADLRAHDIREPFPHEWNWSNRFDCVHQRLLIWGITSTEWPAVVHNLLELIKPGGYVQLVEAQWIMPDVSDQRPEQKKLNLVQTWSTESFGMDIHVWSKLETLLRAEGCEDIVVESFDLGYGAEAKRPEDRNSSAELWAETFRNLASKISEGGIPGVAKTAEDYHAFLDRLVIELKVLGYTPKIKWIVGRKPSIRNVS